MREAAKFDLDLQQEQSDIQRKREDEKHEEGKWIRLLTE